VAPRDGLVVFQGDVCNAATLDDWMRGVDHVLSCLGTRRFTKPVVTEGTTNIVAAMQRAAVTRLAMVSSIGIGSSHAQGVATSRVFMYGVVPLLLRKQFWELAEAEAAACATNIDAVIVRPTGLSNQTGTGRWSAVGADAPPAGGMIPRSDVARFMVSLVGDRSWDGRAVSLYGA
jgi:uncharacterized protein YbjT (DUF2867 family)